MKEESKIKYKKLSKRECALPRAREKERERGRLLYLRACGRERSPTRADGRAS